MISNSHVASALLVAVVLAAVTPPGALALYEEEGAFGVPPWADSFSSQGYNSGSCGSLPKHDPRYLREPDLIVEWHAKPLSDDPFDPDNAVRDRQFIEDSFPFWRGDEVTPGSTDEFTPKARPHYHPRSVASVKLGTVIDGHSSSPSGATSTRTSSVRVDDFSDSPFSSSENRPGDRFSMRGKPIRVAHDKPPPEPVIDFSKVRPLRKTLHDIWEIENSYMSPGDDPTLLQRKRLAALYGRAAGQEENSVMKAFYRCRSQLMANNLNKAFEEVDLIYKLSPDNDLIFGVLAKEFRYDNRKVEAQIVELYPCGVSMNRALRLAAGAGFKAVNEHNWNAAWQAFERVYAMKPPPKLILEIARAYDEHSKYYNGSRDIETCVWCTRFLPVAEDWPSFEEAYQLRAEIEARCYDEWLQKEPHIMAHWPAAKLPLKVYFDPETTQEPDFQLLMTDCLNDWMFVARGKLDYEIVTEPAGADLTIARPLEVDNRYKEYQGGSAPPTAVPRPAPLGTTYTDRNGLVVSSARVYLYDAMQDMEENKRRDIYLHEIGHALGLLGHSKDNKDIMFAYGRTSEEFLLLDNHLSYGDVQDLKSAYRNNPLNKKALEKYTGQRAICHMMPNNGTVRAADLRTMSLSNMTALSVDDISYTNFVDVNFLLHPESVPPVPKFNSTNELLDLDLLPFSQSGELGESQAAPE